MIALTAWWALKPLPDATIEDPGLSSPQTSIGTTPADRASTATALDLTAFRTPLWFTPPSPPAPVIATAPPPRPPLKWQLLAIVRDEGGDPSKDQALFYDPDTDSLRWLRPGESVGVGDRTVERVTDAGVEIRDDDTVKSIALRPDASASSTNVPGVTR